MAEPGFKAKANYSLRRIVINPWQNQQGRGSTLEGSHQTTRELSGGVLKGEKDIPQEAMAGTDKARG